MKFLILNWKIWVILAFLVACQNQAPELTPTTPIESNSTLSNETSDSPEPVPEPTNVPSIVKPGTQMSITIDGLIDDWENLGILATDPSGDQTPQTSDISGLSAFVSESFFYGMISFHNWGIYEFFDLSLSDANGKNYQLLITPKAGIGSFSVFGEDGIPVLVEAAVSEVIEFKIALSEIQMTPFSINNLAMCCNFDSGGASDSLSDIVSIPFMNDTPMLDRIVEERQERPGHVIIVDGNQPADYLYRSFIHNAEGISWGPDGHLYIADNLGRHIVRLGVDGSAEDMGFYRDPTIWMKNGPGDVGFAPDGTMYFMDRLFIYRVLEDNSLDRLDIGGWPGNFEFGPDGLLYYIETLNWEIYRWDFDSDPELIVQITDAHDLAFMLDGRMLVAQIGGKVFVVLPNTGERELFYEQPYTPDPIYITVAPDGDVWIRAIQLIDRIGPDGVEKPFSVEGQVIGDWGSGLPDDMGGWGSSAGIVFDEYGGLWVPSSNSNVFRLTPAEPGREGYGMGLKKITPGFNVSDLISDQYGNLYAFNSHTNELWKISPEGEIEVLFETDIYGQIGLAINEDGTIFIGRSNGEIIRLEEDGSISHYAWLGAPRMTFGSDGALYVAATGEYEDHHEIVRVTDVDTFTVLKAELGGEPFGDSMMGANQVFLGSSTEGGLLVYDKRSGKLFHVSSSGEENILYDFSWLGDGKPWVMGVSSQGVPYFTYHTETQPNSLGYVNQNGELITIAVEALGDPFGIAFSPDGEKLYLATTGAISIIPTGITD